MPTPDWFQIIITLIIAPYLGGLTRLVLGTRGEIPKLRQEMEEEFASVREERMTQSAELKAYTDSHRRASDMQDLNLKDELQRFQMKVLSEFVTAVDLSKLEGRMNGRFDKIETKLDRVIENRGG